jgi:hypothetical protein
MVRLPLAGASSFPNVNLVYTFVFYVEGGNPTGFSLFLYQGLDAGFERKVTIRQKYLDRGQAC